MSGLAIAHLLVTKPPRRDWRSRHLRLTWSVGPPADRHGHSVCARSVALHFREATVTRAIPASRRIPCSSPTGCRTTGYTAAHWRCVRKTVPWRDTSRHILATRRKAPNLRREREKKDGCVQLHVRWPPDHARVAWLHLVLRALLGLRAHFGDVCQETRECELRTISQQHYSFF